MGYNKFITKDGGVLLDLTSDTVAADKMLSGVTSHDKSGQPVTGTFTIDNELTTQDNLIAQIQTALEGKAAGGGGSTEDLDAIITELETKAATLNTTLTNKAAGGGGGAGVESCTVRFTSLGDDYSIDYSCTNGVFNTTPATAGKEKVITDVQKNTIMIFWGMGFYSGEPTFETVTVSGSNSYLFDVFSGHDCALVYINDDEVEIIMDK